MTTSLTAQAMAKLSTPVPLTTSATDVPPAVLAELVVTTVATAHAVHQPVVVRVVVQHLRVGDLPESQAWLGWELQSQPWQLAVTTT